MNFNQIIKEEWEKEFPEANGLYETCIFNMCYSSLVERICVKVWNSALELAAVEVEVICDSSETFQTIDINSILKLKINEQRTTT